MPVFHGAGLLGPAEDLGEVAQGRKAQKLGDLGHGKICFCQQVFAFLDPAGDHVIDGGDPILPLEGVGEIIFIDVGLLGQLLQSQRFLEVQVDILPDGGALAVAGNHLGLCLDRQGGAAHEADDQDLHIGLADILVSCVFQFHFPEDVPQAGGDLHAFIMIQNAELAVGVFAGGQLDALDAQNDVFQRLGVEAGFRVGHIGIDDH